MLNHRVFFIHITYPLADIFNDGAIRLQHDEVFDFAKIKNFIEFYIRISNYFQKGKPQFYSYNFDISSVTKSRIAFYMHSYVSNAMKCVPYKSLYEQVSAPVHTKQPYYYKGVATNKKTSPFGVTRLITTDCGEGYIHPPTGDPHRPLPFGDLCHDSAMPK